MFQKALLFIVSILTSIGIISRPANFPSNDNTYMTQQSTTSSDTVTDIRANSLTTDTAVVTPSTTPRPSEVIYIKPDYSELVAKLRTERDCWRKVEPEDRLDCDGYGSGLDEMRKKIDCQLKQRARFNEDEIAKAIETISKAIDKLNAGVFVDIYDTKNNPQCPGSSRSLMPVL